jgi:hypothetical protein
MFTNDPRVDERVNKIVAYIIERIVTLFHPRSIMLCGSFGRGEVTAIVHGDNLQFLSDCDINLVTIRSVPRTKIAELVHEVKNKYGLNLQIDSIKLNIFLIIPLISRFLRPTTKNYDIKYGTIVIYGKSYLDRIPEFKPQDIPFSQGVRLMLDRMGESIKYTTEKDTQPITSIYGMYKIILACQDTVLLACHNWNPSYRVRNKMFQELFPIYFPELNRELPQFIKLASSATSFKITGQTENNGADKLGEDVANLFNTVFRWAIIKHLNLEFDNYIEFQQSYLAAIKNKAGNLFFLKMLTRNFAKIVFRFITNRSSISQIVSLKIWMPRKEIVHSLIPLMYFASSSTREINESYLNHARSIISNLKDIEPPKHDIMSEYNYLCKETFTLW